MQAQFTAVQSDLASLRQLVAAPAQQQRGHHKADRDYAIVDGLPPGLSDVARFAVHNRRILRILLWLLWPVIVSWLFLRRARK